MKIILDTNILLVSISPKSEFHWVLSKFLNKEFILCVTTDILNEYEEIIGKHMGQEVVNTVLQILENAINVEYVTKYFRWKLIPQDPDDDKFVDCAIACNANFIVTHDKHFNVLSNVDFPKVEVIQINRFQEILDNQP